MNDYKKSDIRMKCAFFKYDISYLWREKMWYVLWTTAGTEEKTRNMIDDHVKRSILTRSIVPYQRTREIHKKIRMFVDKLMFLSYVFVETDHIRDFAKLLQWYPGKNFILQTGDFFCPIYEEEEYFLPDMLNVSDIIDSSNGYMDNDCVKETCGPMRECENRIKKVAWRKSLAILEMALFGRKVEAALGPQEVYVPLVG